MYYQTNYNDWNLKLNSSFIAVLGVISQSFSWKLPVSFDMSQIFQKYACFCQFYNRNDREQNNTFTNYGPQQKIYQPKWNLHIW